MRYNRKYPENHFVPVTEYTAQLSEYLSALEFEDLSRDVIDRAKAVIWKTIQAWPSGANTDTAEKAEALTLAANNGLGGTATRWGKGGKLSVPNAAFYGAVLASLGAGETVSWVDYPASAIVPAAIAAAEERHGSGKDLIAATVAAYEVYLRIGKTVWQNQDPDASAPRIASWSLFASSVAVAKIYGFDARKINQVIGTALEHSSIPSAISGAGDSKFRPFEYGIRARDGVFIARSVEKGIHNQLDTLDDESGYVSYMTKNPQWEQLTKGLGQEYQLLALEYNGEALAQPPLELEAVKDVSELIPFLLL